MLVPARKLLLILLISLVLALLVPLFLPVPPGVALGFAYLLMDLFLFIGLALLARRYPVDPARIFGSWPKASTLLRTCLLIPPLWILTIGVDYALFATLSFVAPDFVQWWFLDSGQLLISEAGSFPLGPNTLIVVSLVLLAPIVEEVFFRGFLLRRFATKWSLGTGVVTASILFALLHANWIGAFCAGVVLSLLYFRSGSLWVPIAVHSVNNLLAVAASVSLAGWTTVSELQAGWPWGLACLVLGGLWFAVFLQRWWPSARDRLPREW